MNTSLTVLSQVLGVPMHEDSERGTASFRVCCQLGIGMGQNYTLNSKLKLILGVAAHFY